MIILVDRMFLYCLDISCLLRSIMLKQNFHELLSTTNTTYLQIEILIFEISLYHPQLQRKKANVRNPTRRSTNETKARPFHASAGRKLCLPRCHNFIWQQNAAPSPPGYDPMALIEDPQLPSFSKGTRKVEGKPFTVDTRWPGKENDQGLHVPHPRRHLLDLFLQPEPLVKRETNCKITGCWKKAMGSLFVRMWWSAISNNDHRMDFFTTMKTEQPVHKTWCGYANTVLIARPSAQIQIQYTAASNQKKTNHACEDREFLRKRTELRWAPFADENSNCWSKTVKYPQPTVT